MYSYVPYSQLLREHAAPDKGSRYINTDPKITHYYVAVYLTEAIFIVSYPGKKFGAKPRPPSTSTTEPDGPPSKTHQPPPPPPPPPSQQVVRQTGGVVSIKTLDRSLKSFLRTSNLSGLDYRLKIAGYNTFNDLLEADAHTLVRKGFTGLMARRLIGAVEEYLRKQGRPMQPYQVVRRGAQIKEEPSEGVKALPTFGKRNVKRKVSEEPKLPQRISHEVHLMSEDALHSSQVIFPHVVQLRDEGSNESTEREQRCKDRAVTETTMTTEQAVPTEGKLAGPEDEEDEATRQTRYPGNPESATTPPPHTAASKTSTPVTDCVSEIRNGDVPVSRKDVASFPLSPSCSDSVGGGGGGGGGGRGGVRRCESVPADFHWLGHSQTELFTHSRPRAFTVS